MKIYKINGNLKYDLPHCNTAEQAIREILKNHGGDFRRANFTEADFTDADFRRVDFSGANFTYADFTDADFSGVDFSGANFIGANFTEADFRRANLSNVKCNPILAYLKNKYTAVAIYTDGEYYLHMEDCRKPATYWINNFWNNTKWFPNDESPHTLMRMRVFKALVYKIKKHATLHDNITPELQELFEYAAKLK